MRKLVEKYECGVVCDSVAEGIVSGLEKLLSHDLKKLSRSSRKMAEEHSWQIREKSCFPFTMKCMAFLR